MKTLKVLTSYKSTILMVLLVNSFSTNAQDVLLPTKNKIQWGITLQSELKETHVLEGGVHPYYDNKNFLSNYSIHIGTVTSLKINNRISLNSGLTLGYRKATNLFYYFQKQEYGFGSPYGCEIYLPEINSVLEQIEVSIPISAQFYLYKNKLSFNLGTQINKSISTKFTGFYYADGGNNTILQDVYNNSYSNWNLGINAGLAYQFTINNRSIQLVPNLSIYPGVGNLPYGFNAFVGLHAHYWFK